MTGSGMQTEMDVDVDEKERKVGWMDGGNCGKEREIEQNAGKEVLSLVLKFVNLVSEDDISCPALVV